MAVSKRGGFEGKGVETFPTKKVLFVTPQIRGRRSIKSSERRSSASGEGEPEGRRKNRLKDETIERGGVAVRGSLEGRHQRLRV